MKVAGVDVARARFSHWTDRVRNVLQVILFLAHTVFGVSVACAEVASAKTLFSGSFVELHVDDSQRDVSVNYPGRGADGICGIELKSSVIVLNTRVWKSLAQQITVFEIHDDSRPNPLEAAVVSGYSPQIFYYFTKVESDYGTVRLQTKDGSSLQSVFDRELGDGAPGTQVIAVAAGCRRGPDAGLEYFPGAYPDQPVEFAENLIRGRRPESEAELRRWASTFNLTTVLSLDDYSVGNLTMTQERAWTQGAGMEFVHMPMHFLKGPTSVELRQAVNYVAASQPEKRIFIHCKHGKDRTGLVVAGFRMQTQRWDLFEAVRELYDFGHSKLLSFWDRKLRSFIQE